MYPALKTWPFCPDCCPWFNQFIHSFIHSLVAWISDSRFFSVQLNFYVILFWVFKRFIVFKWKNPSRCSLFLLLKSFCLCSCLQLLDCFVIPVLMVLSWWILKTRYRAVHFVAVCICLLGVGAMVGADLLAGRDQGSSKNSSGVNCLI